MKQNVATATGIRLAKARANRLLGEGEFRTHLRSRLPAENPVDRANNWYQQTLDFQLNTLASIVQSVGRVTRQWVSSKPSEVRLCSEAEEVILNIFESEELSPVITETTDCYSSLMQKVFDSIRTKARLEAAKQYRYPSYQQAETVARQQLNWFLDAIEQVKAGQLSTEDAEQVCLGWRKLHRALLLQEREFTWKLPGEKLFNLADLCVSSPPISRSGRIGIHNGRYTPPGSRKTMNLNQRVFGNWIEENDRLRFHFLGRGYATEFQPRAPHCSFLYAPVILFSLLKGVAAEEAVRYLLNRAGFKMQDLPDSLFEVADLQLDASPVYIDVKNWSRDTMDRHTILEEDEDFEPTEELSGPRFFEKAIRKLKTLSALESDARLIYINLTAPTSDQIEFYDESGSRCERERGEIIIVPSFLDFENPNQLSCGAEQLLSLFESW